MALTSTQKSDIRADLGIPNDETVFTDAELERLWERANGAKDEVSRHFATLGLAAMQLLNSAAKLHDYSLVSSSESRSQVREHLRQMFQMYEADMKAAVGTRRQVSMSVLGKTRDKDRLPDFPEDRSDDDARPRIIYE